MSLLPSHFFKKNAIAIPKNLLWWQYEEYECHDTSPPIMLVGKNEMVFFKEKEYYAWCISPTIRVLT